MRCLTSLLTVRCRWLRCPPGRNSSFRGRNSTQRPATDTPRGRNSPTASPNDPSSWPEYAHCAPPEGRNSCKYQPGIAFIASTPTPSHHLIHFLRKSRPESPRPGHAHDHKTGSHRRYPRRDGVTTPSLAAERAPSWTHRCKF